METTDYLASVQRAKEAIGRAYVACESGTLAEQQAAASEVSAALSAPAYLRFRQTFAKLAFMMPSNSASIRTLRDLTHTNEVRAIADTGELSDPRFMDVATFAYTAHSVAQSLVPAINERFRGANLE